eukprot:COSAG02_NODE_1908_length_10422_cov_3.592270_4_plen_80_part_00
MTSNNETVNMISESASEEGGGSSRSGRGGGAGGRRRTIVEAAIKRLLRGRQRGDSDRASTTSTCRSGKFRAAEWIKDNK